MNYLLDTNVVSELRKSQQRAEARVRAWVAERTPTGLYLSAISVLEIELGIRRVLRRDPVQGQRLQRWLEEDLLAVFSGRVVPVDVDVAREAAKLHIPDPRPERDALIAATASVHGMTIVTRNVKDFVGLEPPVINPWEFSR